MREQKTWGTRVKYELVVVEDNELPVESGWVFARAGEAVYLMVTRSRYAAPGLGVAWLAWTALGGMEPPLPLAG